jgi:hypothetical protein
MEKSSWLLFWFHCNLVINILMAGM